LNWRLPAVEELSTISDLTEANPSIDQAAFPNTPSYGYWTSTVVPSPSSSDNLPAFSPPAASSLPATNWAFIFNFGGPFLTEAADYYRVRCVSGSRCYPTSRFVVLAGGLIQDTLTGLVWQQQASTTTVTWTAADTYCSSAGAGFRLPTFRELLSIVDLTVASPGPTINQTVFPNTPADWFWTSSPYGGPDSSGLAWGVAFEDGVPGALGEGYDYRVRCVR
jgi:hypothetical protein